MHKFGYSQETIFSKELDIDELGQVALEAKDSESMFYYLIIRTSLGQSSIVEYGPIVPDIAIIPDLTEIRFQRVDFNELKIKHPELNFKKIILLGHSNGGDMSVLFAINNPNLVFKYITLDHRRVAIPRVRKPQILSLRSGDQEPDYGVIPSQEEQDKFGIKIIKLPTIIHNEMNDGANTSKKEEMWQHIINFLKD
jgi:hypothetical protein